MSKPERFLGLVGVVCVNLVVGLVLGRIPELRFVYGFVLVASTLTLSLFAVAHLIGDVE